MDMWSCSTDQYASPFLVWCGSRVKYSSTNPSCQGMQFTECGDVDHGVHGANLPALHADELHQIGVEGVGLLSCGLHM